MRFRVELPVEELKIGIQTVNIDNFSTESSKYNNRTYEIVNKA